MTCLLCDDTSVIHTDYAYSIPCPACAEPPELCAGCGLSVDDCDVYRVGEGEGYHLECLRYSPVLLSELIVMPAIVHAIHVPLAPRLPRELRAVTARNFADTVRPPRGAL